MSVQAQVKIDISLLTCHPGPVIYELEGHSGIRVILTDSVSGNLIQDVVFDWGNFDFESPNFVYRFVKGETDYSIGMRPTNHFLAMFNRENRLVTEQKLNLDDAEKYRLLQMIDENLLPQNRVYRYNYVKDNCATRIVDLLERATGSELSLAPSGLDTDTYRKAMRHYHVNYPWYQFGIDLALGAPLDKKVPDRAMIFAPEALMRMIDTAAKSDSIPLVTSVTNLTSPTSPTAVEKATPFLLSPMSFAILVLLVSIILTIKDIRSRQLSRWFDSVMMSLFGFCGLILTYLIFISVHEATSPNYLYLWLNPACFIVGIGIWVNKAKKLVFCYQIVNFVGIFALCIVFAAGIQVANAAFYPLMAADVMRSLVYLYMNK